jgi:3-deoxy-7-phosphoheptulonate synthase
MSQATLQDTRVLGFDPLVPPALLRHEIVSSEVSRQTVTAARQGAAKIISGEDDRVLVVVGPCSIHDATQALGASCTLQSALAPPTPA